MAIFLLLSTLAKTLYALYEIVQFGRNMIQDLLAIQIVSGNSQVEFKVLIHRLLSSRLIMPNCCFDIMLIAFLAYFLESEKKIIWEWDEWFDITVNQENLFTMKKQDKVMRTQKLPPFFDSIDNYTEVYSGIILLLRQNHQQVNKLLRTEMHHSLLLLGHK